MKNKKELQKSINSIKNKKINKLAMSQVTWFILSMGLMIMLIIILYIFLGDSTSGLKRMITQMFG
jgi:hypothetical protein